MIYGFVDEQAPRVRAMAMAAAPVIAVERKTLAAGVERPVPVLRLLVIVAAIFLFGAAKPLMSAAKALPGTLAGSLRTPVAATLLR